jgi:Ca-activated chloride channel family protein
VAGCPWKGGHRLVRIGLKGEEMAEEDRPASNLVFLLDVSGSMEAPDKLPLLKRAMKLLVQKLRPRDRVAVVVYAGGSGLVLPSTPCLKENKVQILSALDKLMAAGSTHGSEGIQLAYDVAKKNLIPDGINRVILATDGDFNVGLTNESELVRLIRKKAESGIFLTVLGFGTGNLKDSTMEKLADKGNGNYGYIDSITEARKLLVDGIGGTLATIAKDVKIQVEFNPAQVTAYRLIGYENRLLRDEDFTDDTKDAGEIGAGHTVTALYQIVPAGVQFNGSDVDDLKYQQPRSPTQAADSGELLMVKLRYKKPEADVSKQLAMAVNHVGLTFEQADQDFKFAAAVAAFGMLLRDSDFKGNATYDEVIRMARDGRGEDEHGYRAEFINLVRNAGDFDDRQKE